MVLANEAKRKSPGADSKSDILDDYCLPHEMQDRINNEIKTLEANRNDEQDSSPKKQFSVKDSLKLTILYSLTLQCQTI